MFVKDSRNFLRLLSGVYGIVSLFLPWAFIESSLGHFPVSLWGWVDFQLFRVYYLPYYILTYAFGVLALTLALMVLGCFVELLSCFTPEMKGKKLAFSGGMLFSLTPLVFVFGLGSLFSSMGIIFFGSTSGPYGTYSSSVASGFIMSFIAAVPAFLSLGNLRRMKFFLLIWAILSPILAITSFFAYRSIWEKYGIDYGPLILGSLLGSLMITSILTLVYGIFRYRRNTTNTKIEKFQSTHRPSN